MIVEDGRENGRDGRVDGSAVDYVIYTLIILLI
jgi:hypothetical protein